MNDGIPESSKDKKEMHGLGTKSIVNTVKKYNGFVKFENKDKIFFTTILF